MSATLRKKMEDEKIAGKSGGGVTQAALLLAVYERGEAGARVDDPSFIARVRTLCEMTDDQFDREHGRVVFEMGKS